jgi:GTPase SAR1 family protein
VLEEVAKQVLFEGLLKTSTVITLTPRWKKNSQKQFNSKERKFHSSSLTLSIQMVKKKQNNFTEYQLNTGHHKAANGFIVLYDIVRRIDSFEQIPYFMKQIHDIKDSEEFPTVLVANKVDLESSRQISTKEGKDFSEQLKNVNFFESSVKDSINIEDVIFSLLETIEEFTSRKIEISSSNKQKNCSLM